MITCAECNKSFDDETSLHRHLRAHKLVKESYYHKHYPKYDLFTNELLEFRSKEYYFNNWFANRGNCIEYIKELPANEKFDFICSLFVNRQKTKGILYLPSQVELRSSILPSVAFLNKLGFDYNQIAEQAGLIIKYNYHTKSLNFHNEPLEFIQDTREQKPLIFSSGNTKITSGLDFGDYTCKSHFNNVFIERKSPIDFIGTFSNQIERFERELHRAEVLNSNVFVLVEMDLNDMLGFDHIPFIKKRVHVTPEYVFRNIRDLIQKYPNLQFGFCDGRIKMVETIEKIYSCKENVKQLDIQYAIDLGIL